MEPATDRHTDRVVGAAIVGFLAFCAALAAILGDTAAAAAAAATAIYLTRDLRKG